MSGNIVTLSPIAPRKSRVSGYDSHSTRAHLERGWVTLAVTVCCVFAYASPAATSLMQLSRSSGPIVLVATSLTCHLTHWSFDQLFWDVAAFLVLGYFCEQADRKTFVQLLLFSASAVSLSVLYRHPEVSVYRGLSGIDSALFVYLACQFSRDGRYSNDWRYWGGAFAWLAFVGKVLFEMYFHETLFVDVVGAFEPLPITHAVGALAGTIVFAISAMHSMNRVCRTEI